MRLVKGISLFIVCLGLFVLGCFLGVSCDQFFYPGNEAVEHETAYVAAVSPQVIDADTIYVVKKIELSGKLLSQTEEETPEIYLGMDLDTFQIAIQQLNASPPLTELQKGFCFAEIEKFSERQVCIKKVYKQKSDQKEFHLAICKGNVIVYEADGKTVYMETDISAESLPSDILNELLRMKTISSEAQLFDFLETYSS